MIIPSQSQAGSARIPSLDGLRAISILLVIVAHSYRSESHIGPHAALWLIVNGSLGVSIFFVISGYLITFLLLREYECFGRVSLWNFYVRRVFRIFPACYAYVIFVVLLGIVGVLRVTPGDLLSSFTFTWNYSPHAKLWALQHLWSLSVEEQFYVLWPTTLVFLLHSSRTRAVQLAGILILAAPFSRLLTHTLGSLFYVQQIPFMLHTRVDSLMFGCFCALAQNTKWFERTYNALSRFVWVFPLYALIISPLLRGRFENRYLFTAGYTLEGVSIAMSMMWVVRNHNSLVAKLLNMRPLVFVGVLSYSLYIWQEFFLNADTPSITRHLYVRLMAVIAGAILSYQFIERPFLRWRTRFERSASISSARKSQLLEVKPGLPIGESAHV